MIIEQCSTVDPPVTGAMTPDKRLALMNSLKWSQPVVITVGFIDKPDPLPNLRQRILKQMNAWSSFCDVKFKESANNLLAQVRITLKGQEFWSYVGTDVLNAKHAGQATMALGGLTMGSSDDLFVRKVRHETGHTLGFVHEHLRPEVAQWIDPQKAIAHFGAPPNNWSPQKTKFNVLTPLQYNEITASGNVDFHSIMGYDIPDSILKPGAPISNITAGPDFSQSDKNFAASIYPLPKVKENLVYSENRYSPPSRVGTSDIVIWGNENVTVIRGNPQLPPLQLVNSFSYASSWRIPKHARLLADVTGSGRKDLVGFGDFGLHVAVNQGTNFAPQKLIFDHFGHAIKAGGWDPKKHFRLLVDLRGTGRADILGFGGHGVIVSKNLGHAKFSPPVVVLNSYCFDQGWHIDVHPRFVGDVTGNGYPDIIGFGSKEVSVAKSNGDGTFQKPVAVLQNFCPKSGGWDHLKHVRTMADLTGNGKLDIVGFGNFGVYVSFNNGDGTFQAAKVVHSFFGYNQGWRVERHRRLIVDVRGDGKCDIVGFGDSGVWVAINNGNGTFQKEKLVIHDYGHVAGGWRIATNRRTAVDMTGDGKADIVGIGNHIWVSYNQGNGTFGPKTMLKTSRPIPDLGGTPSDLVFVPDSHKGFISITNLV